MENVQIDSGVEASCASDYAFGQLPQLSELQLAMVGGGFAEPSTY